jgi:glycosyltransferase involved in cell wall biosynthesis
MNILFLSHYYPPEGNAPASRVHNLCRRWVTEGHQVTVLTCAPNVPNGRVYPGYENHWRKTETMDGVQVIRIWTYLAANSGALRRAFNFLSYQWSAVWHARKIPRPNVVVATSPQFFCGLAGARIARKKKCPLLLEIRDLWPESIAAVTNTGQSRFSLTRIPIDYLARLEVRMYAAARHIVTVGSGYQQKLIERGVPADKISVITNGVDLQEYRPQAPVPEFRHLAGAGPEHKLVGYIGTVGMAHGLEVVIRAARQARELGLDHLRFVVIGGGARLAKLQKDLQIDDPGNLRFLGLRPKSEMHGWLASVDICLVHLRASELFRTVLPSKMFEAMAMQKPIALGVRGEAEKLLLEAQAGLAFEPEDHLALLEAIEKIHAPNSTQPRLSSRAYVDQKFNWDHLAKRYSSLLGSILASGSKP